MRVWVTGANGQIGKRLCGELTDSGHEVIAFSTRCPVKPSHHRWVYWDMSGNSLEIQTFDPPDVVFHLAAQTSAYKAREDLPNDVATNVLGFVRMLNALKHLDSFPHVILAGAATEVGVTKKKIITDKDPDNPMTFYDIGKVSQRLYLQQCTVEGWLEGTTIRLPNIYGTINESPSQDRGFLDKSIRNAFLGTSLRYYTDGNYIRDFLHIDDAVSAFMSAMGNRSTVAGESFLVGTGIGTQIRDALSEIARQAKNLNGRSVQLLPTSAPSGMYAIEKRDAIVDSSRFRMRTGWESKVRLIDGIQSAFNCFQNVY